MHADYACACISLHYPISLLADVCPGLTFIDLVFVMVFGHLYAPGIGLYIWPSRHIILLQQFAISRAIAHFLPIRPHLYIASFSLQVYAALSIGNYLALGHENLPVEASICMPP